MENRNELDSRRIQALTDATFAVALTIMILEIKIATGINHADLIKYIFNEIIPSLSVYFLSFIILGAFWIDSHFHHHLLTKIDRVSIWLNILFLMFICIIPFSSSFLIQYRQDKLSTVFYCINLLSVSLCHSSMLIYTWKKEYIKPHISKVLYRNLKLRILIPVLIYCILVPMAFYFPGWIILLFPVPLFFQILFGRSKKETNSYINKEK